MHLHQKSYNERTIGELSEAVRKLLSRIPLSANAEIPVSQDDFGGRVILKTIGEEAHISWEINLPRETGPLDGSGALFGDQVFGSSIPVCEDSVQRRTIVQKSSGVILQWHERVSPDAQTLWDWMCASLKNTWSGHELPRTQATPNDYMRTIRALEAIERRNFLLPPESDLNLNKTL